VDFTHDTQVAQLLEDPGYHPVVLAPGPDAMDLTPMPPVARQSVFPKGRRPLVFVIDGTWPTAKKMLRLSTPIRNLPRICFTPTTPSRFHVRRQPHPHCYSTVEAIYHLLELLSPEGVDPAASTLMEAFDWMVGRELEFRTGSVAGRLSPYRPTRRPRREDLVTLLDPNSQGS
jgi:DTW domain-containing protein YfiP